jgi:hypothetical protein
MNCNEGDTEPVPQIEHRKGHSQLKKIIFPMILARVDPS